MTGREPSYRRNTPPGDESREDSIARVGIELETPGVNDHRDTDDRPPPRPTRPAEPPDPRSDVDLIDAINGGDLDAFEALYYRYRDWTLRLARRHTGADDSALDVLQETFEYLYRKFPGFELRASLKTLLFRVVTNTAIRVNQKRRRHAPGVELPDLPDEPSTAPGNEDRDALAAAIRRLSEGHRQVVVMRFVDGLSTEEIAVTLAIPGGTVKSRLHHALAQLRGDPKLRGYFDER